MSGNGNGKWSFLRTVATGLQDKLAEVLIVAMFLSLAGWFMPDMIRAITANTEASYAVKETLVRVIERSDSSMQAREREHTAMKEEARKDHSDLMKRMENKRP